MGPSRRPPRGTWQKRVWIAIVAAAVAGVSGVFFLERRGPATCTHLGQLAGPGDAAGYNVVLVTLDTVRWDRLGAYGDADAETPVLDRLAAGGVRFQDAVTSVPLTLPSHATMLTGLYPPNHGVRDNGRYALTEEHTTLAEDLKARGYDTAAFIGCFVLDERFGLNQGFDLYDFRVTEDGHRPRMPDFNERRADAVTDAAVGWLRARHRSGSSPPFFIWVHYFDPHTPYQSPLGSLPRFAGRSYDAEIAFVDQEFRRLVDELRRLDLIRRTLLVVVADHGEALGEHEEPTHGMLVYECTMRVPFILYSPTLFREPRVVVDRVVCLADLRPTVEDLLGIEPPSACDGHSLLRDDAGPDRAIYIETEAPLHIAAWSPLYGLRSHAAKYILAPEPEYYDLGADRGEVRNLYRSDPPGARIMEERLARLMAGWGRERGPARAPSDEEIERLSALGYVHREGPTPAGSLTDPKTAMDVYNRALAAEALYAQGKVGEAARLARSVLDECAMCLQALRVLAFSYLKLGRADDAIALLRDSVERNPDAFLVRSLVQALIVDQRYAEAMRALDLYEGVDPTDGRVPLLRGDCLAREDRRSEALAAYAEAIRRDENRVGILARERIERLEGGQATHGEGGVE